MNCVVFGATGYLGSKVVHRLAAAGDTVLCVVRKTSSLERLEAVREQVSFCHMEDLPNALAAKSYDCLVNLACRYPRNSKSDMDMFEANFYQPLGVFTACYQAGVRKYLTIGTGLPDDLNVYALSKAKFADVLKWYTGRSAALGKPISVCNVELENFYGEDEPTDRFLPGTVAKLKGNEPIRLTAGTQIRDFVYVEDVLDNLTALIHRNDLPDYLDLPLGSGEGVSIRELVTYLKDLLHSESELCFGAVPSRINEPDSVADREKMQKYGVFIRYGWQEGMKVFL